MNRQFYSKLPSESDDVFIFNLNSAIESESLVGDEKKNDLDQMKVEGLLKSEKVDLIKNFQFDDFSESCHHICVKLL